MATNKLTQYDFPVPTKEKVARGLAWIAMGAAAVVGVNFAGPHVLTALETVFDIGNMLVRIGILAGCAFAGILIVQALWPALKNLIAVMGYQAINFMRENYPLEQMAIWCDYLERKHQETKDGETVIKGVEKTNKEQAKAIQDRLDEIVTALQGNHDLTPEEVNDLEVETAGLRAEKKVYDDMVEQLSEPLATIRLFVEFQDRGIKQYKILMRVSTAQHTANTSLSAVNGVLRNLFGKNPEKDNAIAARENIVRQLGQTFGELEGMQLQMQSLINAARTQDKIGLANAKKYLTERMRTIESTAVRIPDAVPVSGGQASRLLDR